MLVKSLVAGAAIALAVGAASAQSLEHWGEAGGWDVMVDPTLGNSCLIQAEFTDGSVIRIGFDRPHHGGYVTSFNSAWGDIGAGETYPIAFALDNEGYEGEATGIYLDGVPGAEIDFDDPDFLLDIARRTVMTLYHDGYEVMSINLAGTLKALEEAIACQDAHG